MMLAKGWLKFGAIAEMQDDRGMAERHAKHTKVSSSFKPTEPGSSLALNCINDNVQTT